jgi:magnesium and cobalt exporter, CNNM family
MQMEAPSQVAQQTILWPILAALLVILLNAFFVTVEFAVVTVRRTQLGRLEEAGNASAKLVARLLRDPDWTIAATQVGVTTTSILLGIVAEEPLQAIFGPILDRTVARIPIIGGFSAALGALLALLLLSFVHMVLGEQTPKTIALRYPLQSALFVARPMTVFARLTTPLVWLVDHSTALVLRVLGVGGQTGGHGIHTVEELKEVVRDAAREEGGVIPYGDEKMLVRAMEFGGRFVREAMIPRTEMVAVENSATLGELLRTFKEFRHARFPVHEGDLDHICGVVTMKEVIPLLVDDPAAVDRPLAELGVIRPALGVPENRRIGDLFNQMRRSRTHIAIVIDEFGGTAGMVTSEELAEEVVGRLTDEWVTEQPPVFSIDGGAFEIDAQERVDEVNDALKLNLPTSPDYETVAGFLLYLIQRIPRAGEVIQYENMRFTILEMIGRKIERVRVERG